MGTTNGLESLWAWVTMAFGGLVFVAVIALVVAVIVDAAR